ncbi:alkaline-phosphatase-like protein [Pelagophyceae sp. CCMP2097]|nr:alkaline-phosphatase-like protein [Pelagophyceae sp. CCMP2097]|mmetsp:Transcript_21728/g.74691  ORF Transcript_21728/g.74691 Transcript_21728/m.74691 type:complete len:562 (+) Transcript_21728:126-1811(+)
MPAPPRRLCRLAVCLPLLALCQQPRGSATHADVVVCPASSAEPGTIPKYNVLLVVADDLDAVLDGPLHLPATRALIADRGVAMERFYASTPICCPSRAELLSGRYWHNVRASGLGAGPACMGVNVSAAVGDAGYKVFYEDAYLLGAFGRAGYTVGVFGKHLNSENPSCPPPGIDRWFVNGGGNYVNPTFTDASAGSASTVAAFDNCTAAAPNVLRGSCYSTTVIGNATKRWLDDHHRRRAAGNTAKPFFAYVAVKAPHVQDGPGWPLPVAAPWTAPANASNAAPRTPAYNCSAAARSGHHWLVRSQPLMTAEEGMRTDALYDARSRSLAAVDGVVSDLVSAVEASGAAEETFFVFTSDHGYRYGQWAIPQGKWHAYENDVRVPLYIRGPGVASTPRAREALASLVDLLPTLAGLAGVDIGAEFDGADLSHMLAAAASQIASGATAGPPRARTQLLLEYASGGDVVRYAHLEDTLNNTFNALRQVDASKPAGQRNLKYVEFRDSGQDWAATAAPIENEFFDLDEDPFEMHNLYAASDDVLKRQLRNDLHRLATCKGPSCREH